MGKLRILHINVATSDEAAFICNLPLATDKPKVLTFFPAISTTGSALYRIRLSPTSNVVMSYSIGGGSLGNLANINALCVWTV